MTAIADQIRELSSLLEGTDIELLELEHGDDVIRLRRESPGQVTALPAPADTFDIPAPSVGIFRRIHPLRTAPLVEPGQAVSAGDPVGLLQIGVLLVHVLAPKDGVMLDVLVEDGAAVGYGTALMRFSRSGEQ